MNLFSFTHSFFAPFLAPSLTRWMHFHSVTLHCTTALSNTLFTLGTTAPGRRFNATIKAWARETRPSDIVGHGEPSRLPPQDWACVWNSKLNMAPFALKALSVFSFFGIFVNCVIYRLTVSNNNKTVQHLVVQPLQILIGNSQLVNAETCNLNLNFKPENLEFTSSISAGTLQADVTCMD